MHSTTLKFRYQSEKELTGETDRISESIVAIFRLDGQNK